MDEKDFHRELNKYRVVRAANWKRDWAQGTAVTASEPAPAAVATPKASPAPVAPAAAAAAAAVAATTPTASTAAAAAAAASSAAATAIAAAPTRDFYALLSTFLSEWYDADTAARIGAEFRSRQQRFVTRELSLDDIEALAPVFRPNVATA